MNPQYYLLTAILFTVLTFVMLGLILYGLRRVLARSDYAPNKQTGIFYTVAGILIAWLAVSSGLSLSGFLSNFEGVPPRMVFMIFPPLVSILFLTFSKGFTRFLQFVPPSWLIWIQSFRVVVEILLWLLFIDNLLPIQMTFEGRNFDVLAGLTAPLFAYMCFVKGSWSKRVAIIWNIACLLLLANIVGTAILSIPSPFRVFMNEPANTIIATWPIVWLPAFLVPIAYSMHFFSLRQLTRG